MPNSDELIAIVDRILNGSRDESEVAQLRQWLKVSGSTLQFVSQDGKFNTNIGQVQGGEIHIGDRIYQVDLEALRELLQPTTPVPNIDWHAVSQGMLEEQLRLTTNPLTSGEGISYRTEQVYVPLGLVERKRQTRRGEDVSPEQGSLLYEETEITQRFEHEQFLEQVLRQGQSPKSRGKRLAIIGEPGAGKTTLLQQIAKWVTQQVEGAIAIWVSLADLRGQELEPYLLERWLQAVARKLGQAEASGQVKDAFVAQFQPGRVWLLLDGVDEMQVSSGNPLAEMSRQVRMGGLLSQARIVLSCRLNLWDGDRNALDTFDTYRTLEFSYPQQVERFVGQWFGALPEGQGVQAERLCAALKAPGKERIRDLVKNPLRLTLLCFNWYLGEGTLPETKAGLYEQFVADFYEWKREQFPTTAKQRRQLNTALGELAREAIDKEETRFRLRHEFVCSFLGEPDDEDSLFRVALELGWLNAVGVDAKNPRKSVYAFFHPTFQEYFAALAIDDWHFFLNHISENPSHPNASYRIFESQFKEVFLLWLGREDVKEKHKEELINKLSVFEDGCNKFYQYRAFFLAGIGIAEFRRFPKADVIVAQIIKWSFRKLDIENQRWEKFIEPIVEGAQAVLKETDRKRAALTLIRVIQTSNDEETQREAAELLGQIKYSTSEAVISLTELLHTCQNDYTCLKAAESLGKISPGNAEATEALLHLFQTSQNQHLRRQAAENLESLAPDNSTVITTLIHLLKNSQNWDIRKQAVESLEKIAPGNPEIVSTLLPLTSNNQSRDTRWQAIECLGKAAFTNTQAVTALVHLLQTSQKRTQELVVETLGTVCNGNPEAVAALIDRLQTSENRDTRKEVVKSLGKIGAGNAEAISALSNLLRNCQDRYSCKEIAETLGKIAPGNTEAVSALVNLLHNCQDWYSCKEIAETLGEIAPGNPEAISALVNLLNNSRDRYSRLRIVEALEKIAPGNTEFITASFDLLRNSQDADIRWGAARKLGEIYPGNTEAVAFFIEQIHYAQHEYIQQLTAQSLGRSTLGVNQAVDSLIQLLQTNQDEDTRWQVANSLGKIGAGMAEAIAALIHLLHISRDEDTRMEAAKSL
jgi:HEAT repeat protein/energy-coupling factor transporter ATP-binding protein EcfA2